MTLGFTFSFTSWGKCLNVCLGFLQTQGLFLYVDLACILSAQEPNSPSCQKCPLNSTSKNTSGSWQLCQCAFGSIHQDVNGLSCQCPAGEALVDTPGFERCEPCHKLCLTCPRAGSNASSAQVVEGHRRLQPNSHEVFACLDSSRCKADGCAAGQF